MSEHPTEHYRNLMETLVKSEVHRQLKRLPDRLGRFIDPAEVATHALNHLPPLYASSEEGARLQLHRATEDPLKEQISIAVRRGIAAVQRDPLRSSTPLEPEAGTEEREAYIALHQLEDLLQQGELNWHNVASVVRYTLLQALQGELTPQQIAKIEQREPRRSRDRHRYW
ncbi:MAG: late competence development ComFB family protein [Cyanobacteriota bacterium]|nr:late competence development ComFB family protein [Cyanobacteriota bacterium]